MVESDEIQRQIDELLELIGKEEPTEEESAELEELQNLLDEALELEIQIEEDTVDREDFLERRERRLDNDPALIEGEIDSWEMLARDSG